jgi:hypothetical protein
MKCCSCGADLGFDDDPYADPDCLECLRRSIEAEGSYYDEYDRCKVPLWPADWHDDEPGL